MPAPGGYASKAERAQRTDTIRRLADEGLRPVQIAQRVRISPSMVREQLEAMGLRKRGDRASA